IFGLPSPILLAVVAGFAEMIPLLGPVIAFAPAVLVALVVAPDKVVFLIIYAVIVQEIESQVLVPRVMSHAVGVSPLTVLIGIYVGVSLYGILGALIAVPVAAAIQVILGHLLA